MAANILIVDDDMMMRSVLELYIEDCGFKCIGVAKNTKEAIDILEKKNVDIVIIDIYLKEDLNGGELNKIIEEKYNLPVIFISADPDKEIIDKYIASNVFGFLQKPIHKSNFKSTVYFALAKQKLLKKDVRKKN